MWERRRAMPPKPRADISQNTALYETTPLVAPAGFREYDARWRLIDLWNNLRLLGCVCLAIDHERIWPQPQPEFWEAAVVLGVVCFLCLSYLNRRTRAVEIVT